MKADIRKAEKELSLKFISERDFGYANLIYGLTVFRVNNFDLRIPLL